MKNDHYCYHCALARGYLKDVNLPTNLTGSAYQLGKFMKHTVPNSSARTTGIFDDPMYAAYGNYFVNSAASGSVEMKSNGKDINALVWFAGKKIGASFVNGTPVLPNDTVKVVLPTDDQKIHAYSIASTDYNTALCAACKRPVLIL